MPQEMTATGTILATYDRLPESERRVADYILARKEGISSLMAGEIAQASGTSNTTVSRFVRSLGYDSYAQLRLAFAREETARGQTTEAAAGISFDDVPGSVRYVLERKKEELDDTVAALDTDELARVARLLQRSKMVLVAGVGTSLSFAQMIATKLAHVGVRAVAPANSDAAGVTALLMDGQDCILFVSNSGASRRLSSIMDSAEDASIPTALITSDSQSPLALRADHVLGVRVRDQLLAEGIVLSHNSLNFVAEVLTQLLLHDSLDAGEYLRQYGHTAHRANEK